MAKKTGSNKSYPQATDQQPWDVVVIGTGMGGCAAGGITARHGLNTLILEKNPRPGGNCSYYEKQGFRIDTGTHVFGRGNLGPFGTLTRRLGLGTPIQFIQTSNNTHFKGMNVDLILPTSPLATFYKCILPRLAWQTKIHPKHYPSIFRLVRDISRMEEHEMEALNHICVQDFMSRYTNDAEIQYMIGLLLGLCFIVPPWDASAGECIWNLQKFIKEKETGYPKGGASTIPLTFLKGARNHGAEIRMNAGVKKIEVSKGKVTGVVLEEGERIAARTVISTTTVKDTVMQLTGEEYFARDYARMVKALKPSFTAVQAKIGVKKKLIHAGTLIGGTPLVMKEKIRDENIREMMSQLENGELPKMIPIYSPVPSNFDPDLAPKGCQLITAVAVAPTLEVKLKNRPSVWIDALLGALNELIPGLQKNTIFCDTWTVETLARWIGKSSGSAITTAQTPDQVGVKRPSHRTPVKGLYLAGDCAGMAHGIGTELACQSGMDCADLVANDFANHLL